MVLEALVYTHMMARCNCTRSAEAKDTVRALSRPQPSVRLGVDRLTVGYLSFPTRWGAWLRTYFTCRAMHMMSSIGKGKKEKG
jgi:hypothetical protein